MFLEVKLMQIDFFESIELGADLLSFTFLFRSFLFLFFSLSLTQTHTQSYTKHTHFTITMSLGVFCLPVQLRPRLRPGQGAGQPGLNRSISRTRHTTKV